MVGDEASQRVGVLGCDEIRRRPKWILGLSVTLWGCDDGVLSRNKWYLEESCSRFIGDGVWKSAVR